MTQGRLLQPHDVEGTIVPLRLLFWGGLLCVLDVRFNGFDILNDLLGAVMIVWAVFRLGALEVHERYRVAMLVVFLVPLIHLFISTSRMKREAVSVVESDDCGSPSAVGL